MTRRELRRVVPEHAIDHAVRRGDLERVLPRTYLAPGELERDPDVLLRAALRYVDRTGALSHTTALRVWGLPVPPEEIVHVTVAVPTQPRSTGPVVVHRRRRFFLGPPETVGRNGMEVVRLDRTLVESWEILPNTDERRAPLIVAVVERRTTCARLFAEIFAMPNLPGRAQLLSALELLRDGCRSELEIWGHLRVFLHPDLPEAHRQLPIRIGSRTVYLDLVYQVEKVNVELDGAKYHFGPANRERDMRRDAALAKLSWLTVRFSHDRLVTDPDGVRHELRWILTARRKQLIGAAQ